MDAIFVASKQKLLNLWPALADALKQIDGMAVSLFWSRKTDLLIEHFLLFFLPELLQKFGEPSARSCLPKLPSA